MLRQPGRDRPALKKRKFKAAVSDWKGRKNVLTWADCCAKVGRKGSTATRERAHKNSETKKGIDRRMKRKATTVAWNLKTRRSQYVTTGIPARSKANRGKERGILKRECVSMDGEGSIYPVRRETRQCDERGFSFKRRPLTKEEKDDAEIAGKVGQESRQSRGLLRRNRTNARCLGMLGENRRRISITGSGAHICLQIGLKSFTFHNITRR